MPRGGRRLPGYRGVENRWPDGGRPGESWPVEGSCSAPLWSCAMTGLAHCGKERLGGPQIAPSQKPPSLAPKTGEPRRREQLATMDASKERDWGIASSAFKGGCRRLPWETMAVRWGEGHQGLTWNRSRFNTSRAWIGLWTFCKWHQNLATRACAIHAKRILLCSTNVTMKHHWTHWIDVQTS